MTPQLFEFLLKEARAGRSNALGDLLKAHEPVLLARARTLLKPAALHAKLDESELVQTTFLKAKCNFARFRGTTPEQFAAWLDRTLIRTVRDEQKRFLTRGKRKLRREVPLDDEDVGRRLKKRLVSPAPPPESRALAEEDRMAVQEALRKLPAESADVIRLHDLEELPYAKIAERFGWTVEAARKRHDRAKAEFAVVLRRFE